MEKTDTINGFKEVEYMTPHVQWNAVNRNAVPRDIFRPGKFSEIKMSVKN